jgi:hypothetical protein
MIIDEAAWRVKDRITSKLVVYAGRIILIIRKTTPVPSPSQRGIESESRRANPAA